MILANLIISIIVINVFKQKIYIIQITFRCIEALHFKRSGMTSNDKFALHEIIQNGLAVQFSLKPVRSGPRNN